LKDLPLSDEAQLALANAELENIAKTDAKFQALWFARDKNLTHLTRLLRSRPKKLGRN